MHFVKVIVSSGSTKISIIHFFILAFLSIATGNLCKFYQTEEEKQSCTWYDSVKSFYGCQYGSSEEEKTLPLLRRSLL